MDMDLVMEEQRVKLCEGRYLNLPPIFVFKAKIDPPSPLERSSSVRYLSCAVQF